uniref:Uncharacterized protein n=1 Tax=blood disease bacterium R229 TaxID=741978 RepID=G2ZWV9_9RALS|nr:hypothetical protein BDB_mp60006 [blood disease bacterium R229]
MPLSQPKLANFARLIRQIQNLALNINN